jgi:hypothetical protein
MKLTQQDGSEDLRDALTTRMRAARGKGIVALQSYNTKRAKHPDAVMFALEGDDDPIYYQAAIKLMHLDFEWEAMVCNGKDNVLSLRVLLARNRDSDAKNTFFLIDTDFDNTKGHPLGPDLYCTPTYSFENLLVSEVILRELLIGEYKCSAEDENVEKILKLFRERLDEFNSAMKLANQVLHYCRISSVSSKSVENKIKKYVKIDPLGVEAKYSIVDLPKLLGVDDAFDISQLEGTKTEFDALDPTQQWRGKYLMAFFVEFLAHLQEDRCKQEPLYFSIKRSIGFNPRSSIVRTLTSISSPPDCLRSFVDKIRA